MTVTAATNADIAVVGAGPAGLLAALALAETGCEVALIGPVAPADGRTTAFLDGSVSALERLGLGETVPGRAAPLRSLRLIDETSSLLRSPEVRFDASEIGLDAFGWNIANDTLRAALDEALDRTGRVTRHQTALSSMVVETGRAHLTLADGQSLSARLVVGADGSDSLVRAQAGIAARRWSYPQVALVTDFNHTRPHGAVSTEFHRRSGPLLVAPLPGDRSSLVWVEQPDEAERIGRLPREEAERLLERRLHSILGAVGLDRPLASFPLAGLASTRSGSGRVALIGEAAHRLPPIGAQGLNLSVRDVIALADIVRRNGLTDDIGDRFHAARRLDAASRTLAVDGLNRSLLAPFLPVHAMRRGLLGAIATIGPLRRALMREGVEPGRQWRTVMDRAVAGRDGPAQAVNQASSRPLRPR